MPYVVASGGSVAVVVDPNNPYWFDLSGSDYVPRNGVVGVALVENSTDHTLTFTQTISGRLVVTVFNDLTVSTAPGSFLSQTDARGIVTTASASSTGLIQSLERSFTAGSATINESLLYIYNLSGATMGELQTVMFLRDPGTGVFDLVSQVVYGYYAASDPNGNQNDLQTATQQLPNGSGGWNTVAVDYYRYWLGGESTGIVHGLKMHFGPEAYRLMFNASINLATASDATVLPYADHYFEYNPSSGPTYGTVTKEISAVCPSCPGGGTTADLFAYTPNPRSPSPGFNIWAMKTQQTLPDSSQIIVYSNYAGMTMLKVNIDPTGSNKWAAFYRYSTDGQLIWTAQPSAVNGYDDSHDDLLNFNATTSLYQYLNNSTGLINTTNYYTSTNISIGAVLDYVQNQNVRQGQSGSDVLLRSFTYTDNIDSSGNAVYPVATDVAYPSASNPSITITTSYAYTWFTGTNQIQQKTTTLPVIGSGQNGSGSAVTVIEQFDARGNLTQRTDERGTVSTYTYAAPILGMVSEQTLNVQSGVTAPGVNVVTDFTYDSMGRLTQTLGPSHTVDLSGTATTVRGATYYLYLQSVQPTSGTWTPDQTLMGQGYAAGTSPSYTYNLINPVSITNADKDGRTTDQITSVRSSGSGALSPTNTFNQTDWQSWTNIQYDNQHRTLGQSNYFLIPSSGSGTVGTNFGQTTFGYDALERQNRVVSPVGTISRTVWTTPQWVASVWVGTNDTGATDSNPAGSGSPNNMVLITQNQYDGGSAGGDGNLTQQTQYASATDLRVTGFGYDFRDRRTSMTDATLRYTVFTYDNLDRQTQIQSYATSGGTLFAQGQTNFDDRGRVYQTLTYAVNPSTGAVGNALTSNIWYDPSGNLLQQIAQGDGSAFTKTTYNGVNWVTATYRGYNTTGTSYTQAGTVSGDIVLTQAVPTYNEVGNVISTATSDRLNSASTSTTGALTSSNARISYTASWFDGIDRAIAMANYGAISSFTRPTTPPSSSSTVLVSSMTYDNAGRLYQSVDPKGIINQTTYDAAGRTTQTVEDSAGLARTTNFTYALDNQIATLTAVNSTTGNQTTTYSYGTTLATSGVARNDLLVSTAYPDAYPDWSTMAVSDWANLTVNQSANLQLDPDVVALTYNRLGQQATITDQRGTVRTLYYDKLGRQTNDCVTTVGASTDNTVLQIAVAYEVRGMINTVTSYNNATPGSGTVVNQVQLSYNTFRQLNEEQQSHSGIVSGSTPNVQYGYDSGASSSNEIRLSSLTYPNGRVVSFNFGTGMDSTLNRITSISDTSATLASYTYLGIGTVVRITYPQPSVWLDLWGGTAGTFNGLDQFNRIIDQRWQNAITGTPTDIDRYKYGYDQNSNRLWKQNIVGTAGVSTGLDEAYVYDNLNRLTQMQRGVLSGSTIAGTPSREMDYGLDPTGNWSTFLTKTSGTTDLNQTRIANTVNEITSIGGTPGWATPPAYDAAGNMTSFPESASPSNASSAIYDAWNRMVSYSENGGTVATYQYDGRNRRIGKNTVATSETRHFFCTTNWQDIEERVGTSTSMDKQHVWGIRYVDELVCRDDATLQRLYACQDANFNLTSVTNSSGASLERYLFDPYGNRTIMNTSWSVVASSAYAWVIGFQGLIHDVESGLIYGRARYLQPALGRWASRDPISYWGNSLSLHEYLNSGPVDKVDPLGFAAPVVGIGGKRGHWESVPICIPAICLPARARYTPGSGSSGAGCTYRCLWTCSCAPGTGKIDGNDTATSWSSLPCAPADAPGYQCCRYEKRWVEDPAPYPGTEPEPEPEPSPVFWPADPVIPGPFVPEPVWNPVPILLGG